jgi:hypothetical protein
MDVLHTAESQAADSELNHALGSEREDERAQPSDSSDRIARINDFAAESLSKQDSFQSCLGASTADFMKMEERLQNLINRDLAGDLASLADIDAVLPAINAVLRVGRQVERYSQILVRLESVDKKMKSDKMALQASALNGFATDATRRRAQAPMHW